MIRRLLGTNLRTRRLMGETRAAVATEYAVIVGVIVVTALGTIAILGRGIGETTQSISSELADPTRAMDVRSSGNDGP